MSARVARKKTLFSVPESPDEPPALLVGRCSCGHRFFPPQRLGCEQCGAFGDSIAIAPLAARGVLKTFATAVRQTRPGGDAPLSVGGVLLDDGPFVEVVLDVDDAGALAPGLRVSGRLVTVGEDDAGHAVVDLFFAPETA